MSQFGMQMPAARLKRGPSIDMYTGLLALAAICLAGACFVMARATMAVSPDGGLFTLQDKSGGKIQFKDAPPTRP